MSTKKEVKKENVIPKPLVSNDMIDKNMDYFIASLEKNDIEGCKLAIEHKMLDPNDTSSAGVTMLSEAALYGQTELCKMLIERGANVNQPSGLALFSAAVNGHIETCKLLIERGADVNAKIAGATALTFIAGNQPEGISEGEYEEGKIIRMAGSSKQDNLEICKLLIKNGADVNLRDDDGLTALLSAVSVSNVDLVKLLIANKVDVNAKDRQGLTAYDHTENSEIKNLLSNAGVKNLRQKQVR